LDAFTSRKVSYEYNTDIHFHIQVEAGLVFLCMSDAIFAKRRAYAFLVDIRDLFLSKFGDSWQHALAYAMNAQFTKTLESRANYFTNDPNSDKITAIQTELETTKSIVTESIEKLIARNEQIDLLVTKTESLVTESAAMQSKATTLKKKLWWRNVRVWVCLCVCCAIICAIIIIPIVACGPPSFSKCGGTAGVPV